MSRAAIWSDVKETVFDENSYGSIREILKSLGVSSQNQKLYNSKFGITLNQKSIEPIKSITPKSLISESKSKDIFSSESYMLKELMVDFDIQLGDINMLILDTLNTSIGNRP